MADPYISEMKYFGPGDEDYTEIVLDAGADPSGIQVVSYHSNGTVRGIHTLNASPTNTMFGHDIYVVDAPIHRLGAIALVQNGTVLQFISFDAQLSPTKGPAAGLTSTQIGSTPLQTQSLHSTDGGQTYTVGSLTEGTIPCFLIGTRIQTARGHIPIEDLAVGDRVATDDGRLVAIRWIGRVTAEARDIGVERACPIKIPRGALGRGMPYRDLWLSPNHRIAMNSPAFELYFPASEVLIPAKHLVGWMGITQDTTITTPTYVHVLFDDHEIILSEGLPSESFYPSAVVMGAFGDETRQELLGFFPELADNMPPPRETARPCLRGYEAEVAKLLKFG